MTPLLTDSELLAFYRAGAFDDLSFTPAEECRCISSDVEECRFPEEWCDGAVRLSCSNTARLFDALAEAGFPTDKDKDAELLRRFELAERVKEAQAKVLDFALGALDLKPAPDRTAAELEASRILLDAGHSPAAVAAAGRALRNLK